MVKRVVVLFAFLIVAALLASPAVAGIIVAPADLGVAEPGVTDLALVPASGVSFSDLSAGDAGGRDGRFILPETYEATLTPQSDRGLGRPLRRGAAAGALPEPATLLLLGSGLTALAAGRRFRRR